MKRIKLSYVMFDPQPTCAAIHCRWRRYPQRNFLELDKAASERELGLVNSLFSAEQTGCHLISCQWGLLVKVFNFWCREYSWPNSRIESSALLGINAYSGWALPCLRQPYDSSGKLTRVCNRPHYTLRPKGFTVNVACNGRRQLLEINQATLSQNSTNDEFLATSCITCIKFYVVMALTINSFDI